MVDASTQKTDEGRSSLRKVPGRWQATFDPEMSEWGNLAPLIGVAIQSNLVRGYRLK